MNRLSEATPTYGELPISAQEAIWNLWVKLPESDSPARPPEAFLLSPPDPEHVDCLRCTGQLGPDLAQANIRLLTASRRKPCQVGFRMNLVHRLDERLRQRGTADWLGDNWNA